MSADDCPFCTRIRSGEVLASNALAVAVPDAFPLSPGHVLVVPRRHVTDYFELDADVQAALWRLTSEVRGLLDKQRQPDGYNLGVNVGAAAGQTVDHVHVHVIPRYVGDVRDARGGVRWVLPARARYWEPGE